MLQYLEARMDDYKIKKKFYIFYLLCVLMPLFFTDSVITYIAMRNDQESRQHEMENIANSVQYSISSSVDGAAELGKNIYMNKYINEFLEREYESSLNYFVSHQQFKRNTMLMSSNSMVLTLYSDNNTIVNGGGFGKLAQERDKTWYHYLEESGSDKILYIGYDTEGGSAVEPKRRILFLQKLDFFHNEDCEKVLKIELDYGSMVRDLVKMNYDMPVYICQGDKILLSNGGYSSVGEKFVLLTEQEKVGYCQGMSLYGLDLDICVMESEKWIGAEIINNLPFVLALLLVNIVLPLILVSLFNQSFTGRIQELSEAFSKIEGENLTEIKHVRGRDEIGSLMKNYNKMAARINDLIQIVYKNRIREQEMTVARKNAELLALHSQINPHFLFNALESIRMHSIIKQEFETADMVEKLAIMQRQYVEWENDFVYIEKEMDFVRAYLGLQKYRFGDKLSYQLEVEEECKKLKIPKLTVVTFVENACVHGIESKINTGWIFVRIYIREGFLYMEIEDTGSGMPEQIMEKLLYKMRNSSIHMLQDKGRVGIINACLRLKMISDENVQFELESEEGVGTIVQIKISQRYVQAEDGRSLC